MTEDTELTSLNTRFTCTVVSVVLSIVLTSVWTPLMLVMGASLSLVLIRVVLLLAMVIWALTMMRLAVARTMHDALQLSCIGVIAGTVMATLLVVVLQANVPM